MGRTCLHHREGQGHEETAEGTTRLRWKSGIRDMHALGTSPRGFYDTDQALRWRLELPQTGVSGTETPRYPRYEVTWDYS